MYYTSWVYIAMNLMLNIYIKGEDIMSLEISSNMPAEVEAYDYDNNDSSLLFFFLILVIIFCNCALFEDMDESLLFFFLILIIIFNRCYTW